MIFNHWRKGFALLLTLFFVRHISAQSSCPILVEEALHTAANECNLLGRNQVCYGNLSIDVTARTEAPDFTFEQAGDIIEVSYLHALKIDPFDQLNGIWGLAVMQLQANIPDTLPGQNVTFLLFGNTEIEDLTTAQQAPMQVFMLRTGLGNAGCSEAPESALMIQTPTGVESVTFNINGLNIEIGSTVVIQAQAGRAMTINTLEGAAVVTLDGVTYPVVAGTELSIPMNDQMQPDGLPTLPTPFCAARMDTMPRAVFQRTVSDAQPMADAELAKLHLRLKEGLAPCGVPGLTDCQHALSVPRNWATASQFASAPFLEPQPHLMRANNLGAHYVPARFCASDADRYTLSQRIATQQKRFDRLDAMEKDYFVSVAPAALEPIVILYPQGWPKAAPEAPPPVAEVFVETQVTTNDSGNDSDGGGGNANASSSTTASSGGGGSPIIINWGGGNGGDDDDDDDDND